jgi:hypothetical protein
MSKRLVTNYSLWPERTRPGRTPLASAVGGFAIGVVVVVAAYNSILDAGIAGSQESPKQLSGFDGDFEHASIVNYAVAAKPAVPLESVGRGGRPRAPETDGRGGVGSGGSVAALGADSGNSEGLIHEGSISTGTDAEEAKPAPTTVEKKNIRKKRRTISRGKRKTTVRTSRQQRRQYYRKRSPLVSENAMYY